MPYGRNQDGAYFGNHPNIDNKNLIYKRAVCRKIKRNNKLIPVLYQVLVRFMDKKLTH